MSFESLLPVLSVSELKLCLESDGTHANSIYNISLLIYRSCTAHIE